ncbi:hypothetical protein DERP_002956, partial [Dermatophagoides pteronyssinus]
MKEKNTSFHQKSYLKRLKKQDKKYNAVKPTLKIEMTISWICFIFFLVFLDISVANVISEESRKKTKKKKKKNNITKNKPQVSTTKLSIVWYEYYWGVVFCLHKHY